MRRSAGVLVFFAGCTTFGNADSPATDVRDGGADSAVDSAPAPAPVDGDIPDAGAGGDGDGACPGARDCERVVFMTFDAFLPAEIGSSLAATDLCNAAAAAATHPRVVGRKFRAWVSDAKSTPAKTFIRGTKPYIRPSGTIVASDWFTFASETHQATMNEDENGVVHTSSTLVWTGTNGDGTAAAFDCVGWSVTGTGASGTRGQAQQIGKRWTDDAAEACADDHRIYCVEE